MMSVQQLRCFTAIALSISVMAVAGCRRQETANLSGTGDEIIVAGQTYHTGTRVITWVEKNGYNGYAGFKPFLRRNSSGKHDNNEQPTHAHAWGLTGLQSVVDQFVIHYDGHGLSKLCFPVLQQRQLSVHFLLDLDGTIYQTVDVQERALHATTSNDRSIGIEIANVGAFPVGDPQVLDRWYRKDADGQTRIQIPKELGDPQLRAKPFSASPVRSEVVRDSIQGEEWAQYDFTAEQYAALIKLTATLCRLFPQIKNDYPRDDGGALRRTKLPDDQLVKFKGILGHYHIQTNKSDPGPAFQWDKLIEGVREQSK